MEQDASRTEGALGLGAREVISLIETLGLSSFTGKYRFSRRLWTALDILPGILMRGFPHVKATILDLNRCVINRDLWPTVDDRPIEFSHLKPILFHYGFEIWNQAVMYAKLEWYLDHVSVRSTLSSKVMLINQIIYQQLIPEINAALLQSWEQEHSFQMKKFSVHENQTDVTLRSMGLPTLNDGFGMMDEEDAALIEQAFDSAFEATEEDLIWVAYTRSEYRQNILRFAQQRKLLSRLKANSVYKHGKSSETCDTLSRTFLAELQEAFEVKGKTDSYIPRLSLADYATLIAAVAFSSSGTSISEIIRDHWGLSQAQLFTKSMGWPTSLRQIISFCRSNGTDDKYSWTIAHMADLVVSALEKTAIEFTLGSYNNRLTARRMMLLTSQQQIQRGSMQGFRVREYPQERPYMQQAPITQTMTAEDMIMSVQSRFGIDLMENSVPQDLLDGENGLIKDLQSNNTDSSWQLSFRITRIMKHLDTRDARHHYLLVTGQMLFLHRPPPKVTVAEPDRLSFNTREGSRNTKWLAAYVMLGLAQMNHSLLLRHTEQGEGDAKLVAERANRYNITHRLLSFSGCYKEMKNKAGRQKNFTGWEFISLEEASEKMNELRSRAREGPEDFLAYLWPKEYVDVLMER